MKKLAIIFFMFFALAVIAQDQDASQKETPPPGGTPKDFNLPEKTIVNYDNGLRLVMVQWGAIPKATVNVVLKTGNINEGPNQIWLADLVGDLMKEGSTSKTGNEIADAIAGMGGEFNIGVGTHTTNAGTSVLYEFTPDAIKLIADVLMNPSFPASELDRLIKDRQRQVNVSLSRPQPQARQEFMATLYPDHPYGRVYPTEEMLGSYTLDNIKGFYNDNYGAKRTTVYVAGKFNEDEVKKAVEATFATWKEGTEASYPVATPNTTDKISIMDRPNAPQTTVMIGLPVTIDQSNPDWIPLSITNSLLGGSFGSRITRNIREDKGYTYSPFSTVSANYKSAIWYEQADVTTSETGPSLREITKEIYHLQDDPPSSQELEGIQNYQAGIFVLQNSTPGGIISQMVNMDVHNLDDSYLTNYVKNIYAVTPQQVQEMTQKYIKPEDMTIVMVGDKKTIDQQMKNYDRDKKDY